MVLARPSIDGEQARDLTHALELRLDDLLTRQLHSELVQREGGSHQHPPVTNARSIQLLLECLQCLWSHADTKRRLQAFSHLGSYLPWFLRAWNSYPHDVDIPRIVAQILQLWSSTKNATINAELLRSGVVDRFRQAMAWEIPSCHPVHAFILTTLKNLTLRSTEGDNIRMHTDLYNLVVRHAVDGTQSKPVADFISHYTNQNPFLHTHSQDTHRRRSERSERLSREHPIIQKNLHVVVSNDRSSPWVKQERDRTGMLVTETNVDVALRPGCPARQLVSVGNGLVEGVDRAEQRVEVKEALAWMLGLREEVIGTEASGRVGNEVVEVNCLSNSEGPKLSVGSVRPV